jgi:hypothetical protein
VRVGGQSRGAATPLAPLSSSGSATASTAIMINACDDKAGMVASIESVAYELGAVLGVAIMGSVLSFANAPSLCRVRACAVGWRNRIFWTKKYLILWARVELSRFAKTV